MSRPKSYTHKRPPARVQPPPAPPPVEAKRLPESDDAFSVTGGPPVAHNIRKLDSLYDTSDGRLRPGTNTRTIIRLVRDSCPHLHDMDVPLIRAWAHLELAASAAYALVERLIIKGSEQPQTDDAIRMLSECRQIRAQQLRIADSLGLTPKGRKALGVHTSPTLDPGRDEDGEELD